MEVFKPVMSTFGGPLQLADYMSPDVPPPDVLEARAAAAAAAAAARRSDGASQKSGAVALGGDEEELDGNGAAAAAAGSAVARVCVERKGFFDAVVHDRDFDLVTTFLLGGVALNRQRAVDGATALHIAAAGMNLPINELLERSGVRFGSTSSSSSSGGDNALGLSAERLNPPCLNRLIISFLLDNGADIDARATTGGGETPLMIACAVQNVSVAILLLTKGADVAARDHGGRTCLAYAALHPHMLQTLLVWMGEEAMVALARETGLLHDVCRVSGTRFSALFLIEQLGLAVDGESSATRLPSGGANAHGDGDDTILVAVHDAHDGPSGHHHQQQQRRDTPLHYAIETGDLPLVIALLAKGADATALGAESSRTPQEAADAAFATAARAFLTVPVGLGGRWQCRLRIPSLVLLPLRAMIAPVVLYVADVESVAAWGRLAQRAGIKTVVGSCAAAARASSPARRERLLTRLEGTAPPSTGLLARLCSFQLSDMGAFQGYLSIPFFFVAPQLFMYGSAWLFNSFLINLAAALLLAVFFVQLKRSDENFSGRRSWRTPGLVLGMVTTQALMLPLATTKAYYSYYSFDEEAHHALMSWLVPSAILSFLAALYIMLVSPGTVSSTIGHRKGIYASLARAKTAVAAAAAATATTPGGAGNKKGSGSTAMEELSYNVDLKAMVRKPLRAQRCAQTGRVVLRFDHYSAWTGSPIGANNHRAFFLLIVSLFSLFCSFYYFACGYHRILSSAAAQYRIKRDGHAGYFTAGERRAMSAMEDTLFATPFLRFVYMYTQVLLPIIIFLLFTEIYTQLFAIARAVTLFDLEHATTESSAYCFALGERVYSLFDKGMLANWAGFFLFRERLDALEYRVPTMSAALKKVVEDYQKWQVAGGGCGSCGHGHAHGGGGGGGHGHSHGGDDAVAVPIPSSTDDTPAADGGIVQASVLAAGEATARAVAARPATQSQAAAAATAGGGGGGANSGVQLLANHIFQEMVRSGTADVAMATGRSAGEGGVAAETQVGWDEAVAQAREMFQFFQQSMANSASSMLKQASANSGGGGGGDRGEGHSH